jgi:hypothetical protein
MPDHSSPSEPQPTPGPAAAPARLRSAKPPHTHLSPLGEVLERRRLDTGMTTGDFLDEHRLNLRTWWRLIYGLLTANGSAPLPATIIRYAEAAGIDLETALDLARQTFGTAMAEQPTTALGAELHRLRVASGLPTRTYLADRGVAVSTWHRLLSGQHPQPTRTTIAKVATAVGLDIATALQLAEQDRQPARAR